MRYYLPPRITLHIRRVSRCPVVQRKAHRLGRFEPLLYSVYRGESVYSVYRGESVYSVYSV